MGPERVAGVAGARSPAAAGATATEAFLDGLSHLAVDACRHAVDSVRLRVEEDVDPATLVDILAAGGKSIRPRLVALAAALDGTTDPAAGVRADLAVAAAAVELLHVGTLFHDDVMDEGKTRRGVPTANATEGNGAAVLMGDILLAIGCELVSELGGPAFALFSRTLRRLCTGQLAETRQLRRVERTVEQYLTSVSGKTAALMACAAELGGIVARLPPGEVADLGRAGHDLGVALQIRDDVIDLLMADRSFDKDAGKDLAGGVLTLPVILSLGRHPALVAQVQASFEGRGDVVATAKQIVEAGGARDALEMSNVHTERAREVVARRLPAGVDSGAVVEAFLPPLPACEC
jgi:geranylgeranyl pyrophosphate synthase